MQEHVKYTFETNNNVRFRYLILHTFILHINTKSETWEKLVTILDWKIIVE